MSRQIDSNKVKLWGKFSNYPVQVGDTYKLSIAKVGVRDYGEYYCRASNLLDRDVSTAMVLTGDFVRE